MKLRHNSCLYSSCFLMIWFIICRWSVVEKLILNPACSLGWLTSRMFVMRFVTTLVNNLYRFERRLMGLYFFRTLISPFLYSSLMMAFFQLPVILFDLMHRVKSSASCLHTISPSPSLRNSVRTSYSASWCFVSLRIFQGLFDHVF